MPYVKEEVRRELMSRVAHNPGELNFLLTEAIADYWAFNKQNYQTINDIVGALEGAKLEFYRRIAVPYEELKRAENGDVYGEVP